MLLPSRKTAARVLLSVYGLYHLMRLEADAACADLAAVWKNSQDALQAALDAYDLSRANVIRALAARDGADLALDQGVNRFDNTLRGQVGNSRGSTLERTYFPDGLPGVTRASLKTELVRVDNIVSVLAHETDPVLTAFAEPLKSQAAELRAKVVEYDEAVTAQRSAYRVVRAEVASWFDAYETSHHNLRVRFIRDHNRVESYFKHPAPAGSEEADEEEDAAPGGPTVTPAPASGQAPAA